MNLIEKINRKKIRLQNYDYSQNEWYFVTICVKNKEEYFREIKNNEMILNRYGKIVENQWIWLQNQYNYVKLDKYIVMPNHIHGIVVIKNKNIVGNKNFCSLQKISWQTKLSRSLPSIIRGFKIGITKYFRENNYAIFNCKL